MSWLAFLGIILLIWVAFDLLTGTVWLHREFTRQQQPVAYWSTLSLWTIVAVSCFYW